MRFSISSYYLAASIISSAVAATHRCSSLVCGQHGTLSSPAVVSSRPVNGPFARALRQCQEYCLKSASCASVGLQSESRLCTLFSQSLAAQGFHPGKSNTTYYDRGCLTKHCFSTQSASLATSTSSTTAPSPSVICGPANSFNLLTFQPAAGVCPGNNTYITDGGPYYGGGSAPPSPGILIRVGQSAPIVPLVFFVDCTTGYLNRVVNSTLNYVGFIAPNIPYPFYFFNTTANVPANVTPNTCALDAKTAQLTCKTSTGGVAFFSACCINIQLNPSAECNSFFQLFAQYV